MNKEKDDLLDDLSVPSYGCDPKSIELSRRVKDLKIKYDNAILFRKMSENYDSFNTRVRDKQCLKQLKLS